MGAQLITILQEWSAFSPAHPTGINGVSRNTTNYYTPTPFENAFYKYQQRIARTLHNPFPYDFYFKPGSILESRFILEERQRERSLFFPGFGADSKWAPQPKVSEEDLKKFGSEEDKGVRGRWGEADERAERSVHGGSSSSARIDQKSLLGVLGRLEVLRCSASTTSGPDTFPNILRGTR